MPPAFPGVHPVDPRTYLESFEADWKLNGQANLREHLPPPGDACRSQVLRQLVRIDLENSRLHGKPKQLDDYLRAYPEISEDAAAVFAMALEDFRKHRRPVSEAELALGKTAPEQGSPVSSFDGGLRPTDDSAIDDAGQRPAPLHETGASDVFASEELESIAGQAGAHPRSPSFLPDDDDAHLPEPGAQWHGFHLLHELGRGAFGRVYLARQGDLANRFVALKVSTDIFSESQTLAQLQHTNIVPIYSVHQAGRFQAVCMPYFGSATLADLVQNLEKSQSLPNSGKALIGTLHNHRNATVQTVVTGSAPALVAEPSAAAPAVIPVPASRVGDKNGTPLESLAKLNYVQAILWVGARLAEGLTHAHERGVLHRDLKPANVLLTDDCQPMLLDFNLAQNVHLGTMGSRVGGTLPYMAPEHLEAFQGKARVVDARSDLFSLGVILFELLTGRPPFARRSGAPYQTVPQMVADRTAPPPRLRHLNPKVSPATEAIIRRCLEPDPARRYASARDLLEDLERQQENLPLRHTPEPSLAERTRKWGRRHPRLLTSVVVGVIAAILVFSPAAVYVARERQLTLAADKTRMRFLPEKKAAESLLSKQYPSRDELARGADRARDALKLYGALGASWRDQPPFRYLAAGEQPRIHSEIQDLQLLLARATAVQADDDPAHHDDLLRSALEVNSLARDTVGEAGFSKAGWLQRADLERRLGRDAEAQADQRQADDATPRAARDFYLLGAEAVAGRQFREALPALRKATELDPQSFQAWYLQGVCLFELCEDVEAVECYRAALALWPDAYKLHAGRAMVYQRQKRLDDAEQDFDKAIELAADSVDLPELYVGRALVRADAGKHAEAVKDLTLALEQGSSQTRVYFLRAGERERAGDADGARKDRDEGMRRRPTDEVSWTSRGWARLKTDPKGALEDFEEALKCNPRYLPAMQNKAFVLCDHLKKNDAALEVMNHEVALYPDFTQGRVGRGVLLARLGQSKEALEDARTCLKQINDPAIHYQAANIYALATPLTAQNKARALDLLSDALLRGFGLEYVDQDPDFSPIRNDPEFKRRVEAARTLLRPTSTPKAD